MLAEMTDEFDYYQVLQVDSRAEKDVIDVAYRRLAFKYHPDLSPLPDASERMKRINTAYEVLSDPVKRAAYDKSRGANASTERPPTASGRLRFSNKVWRILLIVVGVIILAFIASRIGPAVALTISRILIPIVVISLLIWLFLTFVKRGR